MWLMLLLLRITSIYTYNTHTHEKNVLGINTTILYNDKHYNTPMITMMMMMMMIKLFFLFNFIVNINVFIVDGFSYNQKREREREAMYPMTSNKIFSFFFLFDPVDCGLALVCVCVFFLVGIFFSYSIIIFRAHLSKASLYFFLLVCLFVFIWRACVIFEFRKKHTYTHREKTTEDIYWIHLCVGYIHTHTH